MEPKKSLDKSSMSSNPIKKLEQENQELKNEIAEIKRMLSGKSSSSDEDLIPFNKPIKVMCMVNNRLNLSTEPHGSGHRYTFDKLYEIKNIPYQHVLDINNNHPNFRDAGYYLILDEQVIRNEGLSDTYEKLLDKEKYQTILSGGVGAIDLFKGANEKQQKILLNMIIDNLVVGKEYDMNVIDNIDRYLAKQQGESYIRIADKVKNAKESLGIEDKEEKENE